MGWPSSIDITIAGVGEASWMKIRNANYSQIAGRDELGKRRQEQASDGWSWLCEFRRILGSGAVVAR